MQCHFALGCNAHFGCNAHSSKVQCLICCGCKAQNGCKAHFGCNAHPFQVQSLLYCGCKAHFGRNAHPFQVQCLAWCGCKARGLSGATPDSQTPLLPPQLSPAQSRSTSIPSHHHTFSLPLRPIHSRPPPPCSPATHWRCNAPARKTIAGETDVYQETGYTWRG